MCSESIDATSSVPIWDMRAEASAEFVCNHGRRWTRDVRLKMEGRQPRVGNSQISMVFHAKHRPNAPLCKSPMHTRTQD